MRKCKSMERIAEKIMIAIVAISPELLLLYALLHEAVMNRIKKGDVGMIFIIGIAVGTLIAAAVWAVVDHIECARRRKSKRARRSANRKAHSKEIN